MFAATWDEPRYLLGVMPKELGGVDTEGYVVFATELLNPNTVYRENIK